jgi:HrpA-like RNA helicase
MKDQYKGDVLVFCTGVDDINFLCSIFDKYLNPRVFKVFPLHGKIAVGEQK